MQAESSMERRTKKALVEDGFHFQEQGSIACRISVERSGLEGAMVWKFASPPHPDFQNDDIRRLVFLERGHVGETLRTRLGFYKINPKRTPLSLLSVKLERTAILWGSKPSVHTKSVHFHFEPIFMSDFVIAAQIEYNRHSSGGNDV